MENEKSYSIPIRGITRNTSFHNSDDGDMAEAINIRNKYGKACPVYQIEERPVLEGLDILYIHKTAQYENVIIYQDEDVYSYTISNDEYGNETISNPIKIIQEISKDHINGICHIGNILIIASNDKLYRFIYYGGKYEISDIPHKLNLCASALPITVNNIDLTGLSRLLHVHPIIQCSIPQAGITLAEGLETKFPSDHVPQVAVTGIYTPYARSDGKAEDVSAEKTMNFSYQQIADAKSAGHFVNPVILRAAIKLYDGSYTALSDPVLVMNPAGHRAVVLKRATSYEAKRYIDGRYEYTPIGDAYASSVLAYDITLSFPGISTLNKNTCDGITLFAAEVQIYENTDNANCSQGDTFVGSYDSAGNNYLQGVVTVRASDKDANDIYGNGAGFNPEGDPAYYNMITLFASTFFPHDTDQFKERIKETFIYYKLADIPLDQIPTTSGDTPIALDGNIISNLTSQERLYPNDSFQPIAIKGIFQYNSQLHIYNYSEPPFGIASTPFILHKFTPDYYNAVNALLKNEIISHLYQNPAFYCTDYGLMIRFKDNTQYAETGRIYDNIQGISPYIAYTSTEAEHLDIYYKIRVVTVNTITYQYYKFSGDMVGSELDDTSCYIHPAIEPIIGERTTENEFNDFLDTCKNTKNETAEGRNKLRVSETSNPFVFPVEKTYTLGQGEIIGLAVATQPISQGQFGQYPLYVFCSDGIWALQVGGTDTSYSVQAPISFDVCNNPNSITPILGGIIFSTENGLKILSGNQITKIAETLDGETSNAKNAPSMENAISLIGLDTQISDNTPFKDYLANAHIVYNYAEDELIVYNPSYPYSYCYGNGWWTKRSGRIQSAVTDYPKAYINKGDADEPQWFDLTRETTETLPLFFLTRPCKMGTTAYKRIARSILRTHINGAKTMLFLLGSNDGKNFVMVNKVASNAANRTDILLGRGIKPYKYYAFAFAISPLGDTRFEIIGIDTSFLPVHTGKIR